MVSAKLREANESLTMVCELLENVPAEEYDEVREEVRALSKNAGLIESALETSGREWAIRKS